MKYNKNFKEFKNEKEITEWINKNYTENEINKFDYRNNEAIKMYKGEYYIAINKNIKNKNNNDYTKIISSIQNDLKKSKIKDNIIVTRYLSIIEMYVLHKKTKHKKIYKYPKFVSCTMLPELFNMTKTNKKIKIKIYITKNTNGAFIPNVMENKEYEILLPYDTKIKRIGINKYITII